MTKSAKLNLAGFIAGGVLTMSLLVATLFMSTAALNHCIHCSDQANDTVLVSHEQKLALHDLLIVQANYQSPDGRRPFSNEDIIKRFKSNKGEIIEAQNTHFGPPAGIFYNFRLVEFMYKGTKTLGIIGDFIPNSYFVESGLYALAKRYYDCDNGVGVQLSIMDRGRMLPFGHIAFVYKGAATDDFRLTEKELIKILE